MWSALGTDGCSPMASKLALRGKNADDNDDDDNNEHTNHNASNRALAQTGLRWFITTMDLLPTELIALIVFRNLS